VVPSGSLSPSFLSNFSVVMSSIATPPFVEFLPSLSNDSFSHDTISSPSSGDDFALLRLFCPPECTAEDCAINFVDEDDTTDPFGIIGNVGLGSVEKAGEPVGIPSETLGSLCSVVACAYTYGCLVGLGVGGGDGPGGHELFHADFELQ